MSSVAKGIVWQHTCQITVKHGAYSAKSGVDRDIRLYREQPTTLNCWYSLSKSQSFHMAPCKGPVCESRRSAQCQAGRLTREVQVEIGYTARSVFQCVFPTKGASRRINAFTIHFKSPPPFGGRMPRHLAYR